MGIMALTKLGYTNPLVFGAANLLGFGHFIYSIFKCDDNNNTS